MKRISAPHQRGAKQELFLIGNYVNSQLGIMGAVVTAFGDEEEQRFRERVRDAIQAGGKSGKMSAKTGIPVGTLNKYVALRSEPSATNALKIAKAIGLTLEELADGKTSPLDKDESRIAAAFEALDSELLERLADKVAATFHALGQKPPQRRITREAGNLYNDLQRVVPDLDDAELIEAALPMLLLEFRRRIEQASAEPGTGKRLA